MNSPAVLSPSTIVTLSAVFIIIMILLLMRKALATILTAILIAVIVIVAVEATTGQVIVNLGEFGDFAVYYLLKLFEWVQSVFMPLLKEIAEDIGRLIA
jgi:hypothetical protein